MDGRDRRRHRLPRRAVPGRGLHQLRLARDRSRGNDVQRHRADGGDELQLPGPGKRCRRSRERLLEHGDGHDAGRRRHDATDQSVRIDGDGGELEPDQHRVDRLDG